MLRPALALATLLFLAWGVGAADRATTPWSSFSLLAANETPDRQAQVAAPVHLPVPPLPERKPAKGAEAVPETWSPQEIADARARCKAVLERIQAVTVPHPPIKEGRCGAAAPIRLMALGTKPQVSFSPPALVNCEMAGALHKWITGDVQRLAKVHLGERITKVEVMSDYSCRGSYGRRANRLSEHAYADALDIRGFVTESGKTAHVLGTWGTTKRDIVAQIAAIKAEAVRQAALRAEADKAAQRNLQDGKAKSAEVPPAAQHADTKLGTPGAGATRTRVDGVERITVTLPGAPERKPPLRIAARLGGPSAAAATPGSDNPAKFAALSPMLPAAAPTGPRAQFLRAAHAAACRIFGTTLGPEANEAHRNHFHVDMAERKVKKICD
jgi:hypothetical protein